MVADVWRKIKREFARLHPVWKAVCVMALISPLTLFAQFLYQDGSSVEHIRDVTGFYHQVLQEPSRIIEFVIIAPLEEEFAYRVPAWIAFIILLLVVRNFVHTEKGQKWTLLIGTASIWLFIIIAAIYWAAPHDFPLTVFAYGMIWSWVMMRTRNIIYPFLFHAGSNAIAAIALISGMHEFIF